MIKVNIRKNNNIIAFMEVKGHADYDVKGKDIVCAGVSLILIGGANSFEKDIISKNVSCEIKEGYFKLKVIVNNENIQNKLQVIKTQLETIEEKYKKNVKIIKEEI